MLEERHHGQVADRRIRLLFEFKLKFRYLFLNAVNKLHLSASQTRGFEFFIIEVLHEFIGQLPGPGL